MQGAIAVLLFVAGFLLGIRLIAALYAPIDLWYTIRTTWPVAARRVIGWTGVTVAALLLTEGGWRWALVAGLGVSLLLHVGSWAAVDRAFPRTPGRTPMVE